MKESGATNVQSGCIHLILSSPSSRILPRTNAHQQSTQNLCPQDKDLICVCSSSKQIWHTVGSGCVGGSAFAREADSAAERRVVRLFATEEDDFSRGFATRPDDVGDGERGGGEETPAFTLSSKGVSMYCSINRSLFQFIYRNKREAMSLYRHRQRNS